MVSRWFVLSATATVVVLAYVAYDLTQKFFASSSEMREKTPTHVKAVVIMTSAFFAAFPIPTLFTLTCVGSGFILGFTLGVCCAVPGVLIGMVVCFAVCRHAMRDAGQAFVVQRFPLLANVARDNSYTAIIALRFMPIPSSFQTVFWACCTAVETFDFSLASSAVLVPHIALLVHIGASSPDLVAALKQRNGAPVAYLAAAVSVFVAVWWLGARWAKTYFTERGDTRDMVV
jgi:uncharacterized membrane protein YdjX (TVP38/TMEM64 family)